ncbi:unnamed protein product [Ambrosiozyma monospora]|uniref:Unnamed protein product n=1 Tax=Ambrosiozyma monospora TaxID=43982 RepID=A0A9W7DJM0_AMBMO|nr:unnamed protein product [Ambrosiozyma monospora]
MPDELGLLTVGCSIAKDAKIPYILPTAMKKLAEKPPGPSRSASRVRQPTLSDDQLVDSSSLDLVPAQSPSVDLYPVDSIASVVSSTSQLAMTDLNTILVAAQPFVEKIHLQLTFRPSASQVKPPEIHSIKPVLRSITLASPYSIPITFDTDCMLLDTNSSSQPIESNSHATSANNQHELIQLKQRFAEYLTKIRSLSKESGRGMDRQLFYDLLSITNLTKSERILPIFTHSQVNQQPHWNTSQTPDGKLIYTADLPFGLVIDKHATKTLTVLPNFDSCFFTRRYYIGVHLSLKKASTGEMSLNVPVSVGQYIKSSVSHDDKRQK